ncbi:MAG: reverse transcriptase domain-containing protein, partial [Plesiomonas shigelloides]
RISYDLTDLEGVDGDDDDDEDYDPDDDNTQEHGDEDYDRIDPNELTDLSDDASTPGPDDADSEDEENEADDDPSSDSDDDDEDDNSDGEEVIRVRLKTIPARASTRKTRKPEYLGERVTHMELSNDDAFFKSTLAEVDRRVRRIKERGFKTSSKKNKAIFKLHGQLHAMVANDTKGSRNKECGETKEWERCETKECKPTAKKQSVRFDGIPWKKIDQCHTLIGEEELEIKEHLYSAQNAKILARYIIELREGAINGGASFAQNHIFQKGLKLYGARGTDAAGKELDQLHSRCCFTPRDVSTMTAEEKAKALEALMFLTEKRDKSIKARMVANGKPSRVWNSRGDSASPTAALESILLTCAIDAKEGRDILTGDVPNAFIQTPMPPTAAGEARIFLKIKGVLVDLLVKLAPEVYGPFVIIEGNHRVLYCEVLQALYGMLQAALLWYKLFRRDLESIGFEFNSYDPCVCNRRVNGLQQTVRFHVDDLMSSHMDPVVNDQFLEWLNRKYGTYGQVKATRGNRHDYLGMTIDFSQSGKVIIDMRDYVAGMLDDFEALQHLEANDPRDISPTPAAVDLFDIGDGLPLDKARAELFHTIVAKGLFLCKRARP